MEVTKQRKWALKYKYGGSYQYAGMRYVNDKGYTGADLKLTKALLFDTEQEALQDMMKTYKDHVPYNGTVYPIPVPVIVETKTVTEIYEEGSINDPD